MEKWKENKRRMSKVIKLSKEGIGNLNSNIDSFYNNENIPLNTIN